MIHLLKGIKIRSYYSIVSINNFCVVISFLSPTNRENIGGYKIGKLIESPKVRNEKRGIENIGGCKIGKLIESPKIRNEKIGI